MTFKIKHVHGRGRHALAGLVDPRVEKRLHLQACCGCRPTDIAQHGVPGPQGLPRPIEADMAEQAMLNGIPLRAAGRIMAHSHCQSQPVAHLLLPLLLPLPRATPVTASSIGQDQELVGLWEGVCALTCPPASDGLNRKLWGVGRRATSPLLTSSSDREVSLVLT
jgi:hypothetical protein